MRVIFFDVETSGFAPLPIISPNNRIIQFASVSADGLEFTSRVNHHGRITPFSSRIHRIKDTSDAPSFDHVWESFLTFFEVREHDVVYLCAHNCHWFDMIMVMKENVVIPHNVRFVDTLPVLRALLPVQYCSYKLTDLYEFLMGEKLDNAHDATVDTHGLRVLIQSKVPYFVDKIEDFVFSPETTFFPAKIKNVRGIGPFRLKKFTRYCPLGTTSEARKFFETPEKLMFFLRVHCFAQDIGDILMITMQIMQLSLQETLQRYKENSVDVYARGLGDHPRYMRGLSLAVEANSKRRRRIPLAK